MTEYVYNLRYLSEDTNPWDSNESYGIFAKLEDAQEFGMKWWTKSAMGDTEYEWAPIEGGIYTHEGYIDGWYLVEPEEIDPDDGTVCADYGLHITKEPLQ